MNLKKATLVLNRLAGLLFSYRPKKRSVIVLDGRWTFEVWPTMSPDADVDLAEPYTIARAKVEGLHKKHINAPWYGEMGLRNETYEWSLTRGTD